MPLQPSWNRPATEHTRCTCGCTQGLGEVVATSWHLAHWRVYNPQTVESLDRPIVFLLLHFRCRRRFPVPRPAARTSKSLSFRLSGALLDRLAALAEAEGVSLGEKARELVTAVLQDEDRLRVLEEVQGVRERLDRLRSDVATSLEMILLNVGKDVSADQVRDWVTNNLRR